MTEGDHFGEISIFVFYIYGNYITLELAIISFPVLCLSIEMSRVLQLFLCLNRIFGALLSGQGTF